MQCQKVTYQTKKDALADIKHIKNQRIFRSKFKKSPKDNRKMRTYECRRCGLWHLTVRKKQ